jgi:hypothetical protein
MLGNTSGHRYAGTSSADGEDVWANLRETVEFRTKSHAPRLLTSMLPEIRERLRATKSNTWMRTEGEWQAPAAVDVDIGALPAPVSPSRSISPEVLDSAVTAKMADVIRHCRRNYSAG